MIGKEREEELTELESFTYDFVRRAKKLVEEMKIPEALDLSEKEKEFTTVFLAERIAKANQYYYLQESKRIFPTRKGFLAKIVEKIFNDDQKLTNLACQALEKASQIITEGEEPRRRTIYWAINDLSARINQENDFWQDSNPLANYQLRKSDLWQWGVKWREKLEEAEK